MRKNSLGLVLRLALLLPAAGAWPAAPSAQDACSAETPALRAVAGGVDIAVSAPAGLKSGDVIGISWRAASRPPPKQPVFAVLAIPGEVRIEAAAPPKVDQATGDASPNLPGVLALPATAPGPLDLAFGSGKTRLLVPLHQPGSKLSGTVGVRAFDAGPLRLEWSVVANTACGERILAGPVARELTVGPGKPEIVVQDPFDIDVPQRVVISNSGRYRLHVFEGRYRVFDLATGAKLVDRAGHAPNFSPTSRFVVADIGDADGRELEVVDLVSQQVIYTALGPFVGWANGDAFLVDGAFRMGGLSVRPTLISSPAGASKDEPFNDGLALSAPGSCNACSSWTDSPMTLDLDNGIVVFPDTFGGDIGNVYELASGAKGCCAPANPTRTPSGAPGAKADVTIKQFVAATYEVQRIDWKPGWSVRGGLSFSHIFDPLAKPDPTLQDQEWYKGAIPLRQQLVQHRQLDKTLETQRIAGLADGVVLRGDWRQSVRRAIATGEPAPRSAMLTELANFGLLTAPPMPRETIPLATSSASEETRGRYATENKKLEAEIQQRAKALERRLVGDVPAVKPHLGQPKKGELPAFPYDGDLSQGKIMLTEHLEGLWRWEARGNPLWLMQLLVIEGSGAFGQGALLLLEGQRGAPGKVTSLSKALEGFWGGQYGTTAQQTRVKPQLFFGRYLVVALASSRSIGVYDAETGTRLALMRDIPQADLLEDVLLSGDGRHVLQVNSDGQFFLHEVAGARVAVSGRYVDGEIIIYTPEGYYWSSYEGAHFVQLRFPGLRGLYPFQQFAAVLNRPELIKARLEGGGTAPEPRLAPPPVVEARLLPAATVDGGGSVAVAARSAAGLARLRLYQDGRLVADRPLSGESFQGTIALPASGNARWLTVLATDAGGLISSPQTLPLAPGRGPVSRLHGVLVGVDTYAEARLKLTYAKSDATRLTAALKAGTGRYYGDANLRLLLDAEATPAAIAAALEQTVAGAEAHDTVVFSFAGHGVKGEDGHYYLTPSGYSADDPKGTGLAWAQVAAILGRARGLVIVILDSCHSGLTGAEGLGTNDDAVASLLSGARAPMLVLAASKGRQFSYEDRRWGGGAFTHALVDVLERNWRSADLNGNGAIEVSELYRALRSIVARETKGNQTPWLARQDLIGDFAIF